MEPPCVFLCLVKLMFLFSLQITFSSILCFKFSLEFFKILILFHLSKCWLCNIGDHVLSDIIVMGSFFSSFVSIIKVSLESGGSMSFSFVLVIEELYVRPFFWCFVFDKWFLGLFEFFLELFKTLKFCFLE